MVAYNNYYPFGSLQPKRYYGANQYRYGFNGKEKDDEWSGTGATYDYGFRIYDSRIAKFLSVDPMASYFPWYTPYQFAGNTPVQAIDIDGFEPGYFMGIHGGESDRVRGTWVAYNKNTIEYKAYQVYMAINNIKEEGDRHVPDLDQIKRKAMKESGPLASELYSNLIKKAEDAIKARPDYFSPERKLNNQQLERKKIELEYENKKYEVKIINDKTNWGSIIEDIGDGVEIVGYFLIAGEVTAPAGVVVISLGKGLSIIGLSVQTYNDLEKGKVSDAVIRVVIGVTEEVVGSGLDKATKSKVIKNIENAGAQTVVKGVTKTTENAIIDDK